MVKQSFAFSIPVVRSPTGRSNRTALALRGLSVDAPFDGQSFLYRTGEFSYERDPYAEFLVSPVQALTAPLQAYLRRSGAFSDVVEPGSALVPGIIAEVSVSKLYGDFRN